MTRVGASRVLYVLPNIRCRLYPQPPRHQRHWEATSPNYAASASSLYAAGKYAYFRDLNFFHDGNYPSQVDMITDTTSISGNFPVNYSSGTPIPLV